MRHGRRRGQSGQAILLLAVLILVLLGFTGLVVDGGRAYDSRRSLEAAAEAAAHAGAYQLETAWDGSGFGSLSDSQVQAAARGFAGQNGWDAGAGRWYLAYVRQDYTTTDSTLTSSARGVLVQLSMPQSPSFMRALGVRDYDIFARATAMFGSAMGTGVIPFAVGDDGFSSYGYDKSVTLQPALSGGGWGLFNYGSFYPEPSCGTPPPDPTPAPACYTDALRNGTPVQVGKSYPVYPPDMSSLSPTTAQALQDRIAARPNETCDPKAYTYPSPRIVYMPVTTDFGGSSISLLRVRAFFISALHGGPPPAAYDGLVGCFVKVTASSGEIDPSLVPTGYGGVTIMKLVRSPGSVISTTVSFQSLTQPATRGQNATLTVKTLPGAFCTVSLSDPVPRLNNSLAGRFADSGGLVSWTWKVDSPAGAWDIEVPCSRQAQVGRGHVAFIVS